MEPQRADLWEFDLELALKGVRDGIVDTPWADYSLPVDYSMPFYARQVIFPELRMGTYVAQRHSVGSLMPGMDDPLNELRVDFLVDATLTDSTGAPLDQGNSRIVGFLRAWHMLARIGRVGRTVRSIDPANLPPLPLSDLPEALGQRFMFDVHVRMYRGIAIDTTLEAVRRSTIGMEPTTVHVLKKCWLAGYQLGQLDQETSALQKVTGVLVAQDITLQTVEGSFGQSTTEELGVR